MIFVISDVDIDYSVPPGSLSIGPFSQASRRACVTVNIIDDDIAENLESFSAMLVSNSNSPDQLTINPDTTTVNIQDNDGEFVAHFKPHNIFIVTVSSLSLSL